MPRRVPPELLVVIPEPRTGWIDDRACVGLTPADFFADNTTYASLRGPLRCERCPVRLDCLAVGIRDDENWGVWGGLDPKQRRALRRLLLSGAARWDAIVKSFEGGRGPVR